MFRLRLVLGVCYHLPADECVFTCIRDFVPSTSNSPITLAGFGAWQTVSVRMVDEEEEALLREEEEMREREEARRLKAAQEQGSRSSKVSRAVGIRSPRACHSSSSTAILLL
jgi:hypothetical protein